MGLYYGINYKDGALVNTSAVEGAVFPVAINSWTTTSVSFTAAQSGYAGMSVYTYNNGWSATGYVYQAVDDFKLVAVVPEPSTYAMALAGLACGGYSLFRRRVRA